MFDPKNNKMLFQKKKQFDPNKIMTTAYNKALELPL